MELAITIDGEDVKIEVQSIKFNAWTSGARLVINDRYYCRYDMGDGFGNYQGAKRELHEMYLKLKSAMDNGVQVVGTGERFIWFIPMDADKLSTPARRFITNSTMAIEYSYDLKQFNVQPFNQLIANNFKELQNNTRPLYTLVGLADNFDDAWNMVQQLEVALDKVDSES